MSVLFDPESAYLMILLEMYPQRITINGWHIPFKIAAITDADIKILSFLDAKRKSRRNFTGELALSSFVTKASVFFFLEKHFACRLSIIAFIL